MGSRLGGSHLAATLGGEKGSKLGEGEKK